MHSVHYINSSNNPFLFLLPIDCSRDDEKHDRISHGCSTHAQSLRNAISHRFARPIPTRIALFLSSPVCTRLTTRYDRKAAGIHSGLVFKECVTNSSVIMVGVKAETLGLNDRALITESETEIKQTKTHGFSGNPVISFF